MQLFTHVKSFKNNPILGNKWLNKMGLHVVRLLVSHAIMSFRMTILSFNVSKEHKDMYREKGYILIENVLDDKTFDTLKQESKNLRAEVRECIQGDTLTQRIHLDEKILFQMPTTKEFLMKKEIVKLFKFTAGKNHLPISHMQMIKSNYVKGKDDPQKNLHSDTFHPTMKYWFFLQDVTSGMAPFTYVEGSNKLTWKRLKWEYMKSISMDTEQTSYSKNGSFRVEEDELKVLGLPAPKEVCVSKNTLVIVNTFGFHRRGHAKGKSLRAELWGISRTNPFNPFVGFGFAWQHRLDNWGLHKLRELKDKQASKQGRLSSWHKIKSETLYED